MAVLLALAAAAPAGATVDLTQLSFEELANIRVTSVSRRPEPLAGAAASIHVITAEAIRRSGATTLPDALRLAPNLHVAQASGSGYAISARGMNGSNNSAPNKLLVLIDGRSVYTPLFSGVFWDAQHLLLEDIERIEVISGPGGTLWGVNAVNGVINVVTRPAGDTQRSLATVGAGNHEAQQAFRHGGALGERGHYRLYALHRDHAATETAAGLPIDDAGHRLQVGFRADLERFGGRLSMQAGAYEGSEGQPAPGAIAVSGVDLVLDDIELAGSHLMVRWDRLAADGSQVSLQAYHDRTERVVPPTFAQDLDLLDLQFQHGLRPLGRHRVVWGANLRHSRDRVTNSAFFAFLPAALEQSWTSLFVQDEISLGDDWRATLGARLEHNDYTGFEFLPNARLAWQIDPHHLLWAAASRAVRAPSRLDRDAYVPGIPPFLLDGGRPARSEVAEVVELGWRGQPGPRLSWAVTLFHTDYDHLRTQEVDPGGTFLEFASLMEGRVRGLETWATWQPSTVWRISAGFTALDTRLRLKPGSNDLAAPRAAGNDPSNLWQLRAAWTIDASREFDLAVRHVGALANNAVPAYTALDARFGWHLRPGLELSISGRNLLGSHAEYRPVQFRSEFEAQLYARLAWSF